MKTILVQTVGAGFHVEHKDALGNVLSYHYLGGTTQTHSWQIPVEVTAGDTLRVLWGTFPTWVYMGSAYTVTGSEGVLYVNRTTAAGPSGSMSIAWRSSPVETASGIPSWFFCDASEFASGMVLGAGLYWVSMLVAIVWRRVSHVASQ